MHRGRAIIRNINKLSSFYKKNGFVALRNALDDNTKQNLVKYVNEIEAHPKKYLNQYELNADNQKVLCRTEYITNGHRGAKELIVPEEKGLIPELASIIHGSDIKLYKEKINYKYPNTGAYRPHQDVTAYPNSKNHITCLVGLCDTDTSNGCLEFGQLEEPDQLLEHTNGVIREDIVKSMTWHPVPTKFGDIVLFNSYVPHKSNANITESPRKVLYLVYNDAAEGDLREEYYKLKLKSLGKDKISLIDHYAGNVLTKNELKRRKKDKIAKEIIQLFHDAGGLRYDEHITQLEHALQTMEYAKKRGESEQFQLGCFLHDIGHLILDEHCEGEGFLEEDLKHEDVGHLFLKQRFDDAISNLAKFHVLAKRYLCSTDSAYFDTLSEASKRSFHVQNGFMTKEEIHNAGEIKNFLDAVKLRKYEDMSKIQNNKDLSIDLTYCEGLIRKFARA